MAHKYLRKQRDILERETVAGRRKGKIYPSCPQCGFTYPYVLLYPEQRNSTKEFLQKIHDKEHPECGCLILLD